MRKRSEIALVLMYQAPSFHQASSISIFCWFCHTSPEQNEQYHSNASHCTEIVQRLHKYAKKTRALFVSVCYWWKGLCHFCRWEPIQKFYSISPESHLKRCLYNLLCHFPPLLRSVDELRCRINHSCRHFYLNKIDNQKGKGNRSNYCSDRGPSLIFRTVSWVAVTSLGFFNDGTALFI